MINSKMLKYIPLDAVCIILMYTSSPGKGRWKNLSVGPRFFEGLKICNAHLEFCLHFFSFACFFELNWKCSLEILANFWASLSQVTVYHHMKLFLLIEHTHHYCIQCGIKWQMIARFKIWFVNFPPFDRGWHVDPNLHTNVYNGSSNVYLGNNLV